MRWFFFNFLYERGTDKHVAINFNEGIFLTQTALPLPVKGEKNADTVECPSINSLKPIPFPKGQMSQWMKVLYKGEIYFREGDEKTRLMCFNAIFKPVTWHWHTPRHTKERITVCTNVYYLFFYVIVRFFFRRKIMLIITITKISHTW